MQTLVVPGVRVEARFDVLPPLPAPAGILGVVGIVDRPPAAGTLVGVSNGSELRQLLGPGTESTMPQAFHALGAGASEAVISAVAGGSPASVTLLNGDSEAAISLRCRANGEWGRSLSAEVRGVADAEGSVVRVTLRLLRGGRAVESFNDLRIAAGETDDLIDTINRQSRFVVAVDAGLPEAGLDNGTFAFNEDGDPIAIAAEGAAGNLIELLVGDEVDPNGLSVVIGGTADDHTIRVFQGGLREEFDDLSMNPDSERYLPFVLLAESRFIRVRAVASGRGLPRPTDTPVAFSGGSSPNVNAYRDAIQALAEDTRVDLVLAAIEPQRSVGDVHQIHQHLVAHAVTMADNGAPRIAFGSITAAESSLDAVRTHAAAVRNRRFVLVSPAGAEGAVAGLVGRMSPHDSPTFKPVPLFGIPPASYRESELNRLLGPNVNLLVVQERAGRGVVVLRGLDTTGDQISVTRVADQAIRETRAISENFIGRLNSDEARIALKEQIVATFTRMERAGALVPSTDGSDPAFMVDVYSTQQDFAQGIVRIDIAVRPVRAIDYIYATIRVKN